jgi:integrase
MMDPMGSSEAILDELVRESERGMKPQSLNHIEYDIKARSKFLSLTVHPPRFGQSPTAEPWIPTDDDVAAIRRTASSLPDTAIQSRNSCIIDLLFAGGMRIWKLIRINLEDLEGNLLHIRSKKNERRRIIGLPQSLTERINEYILTFQVSDRPFRALHDRNKTPQPRMGEESCEEHSPKGRRP